MFGNRANSQSILHSPVPLGQRGGVTLGQYLALCMIASVKLSGHPHTFNVNVLSQVRFAQLYRLANVS